MYNPEVSDVPPASFMVQAKLSGRIAVVTGGGKGVVRAWPATGPKMARKEI